MERLVCTSVVSLSDGIELFLPSCVPHHQPAIFISHSAREREGEGGERGEGEGGERGGGGGQGRYRDTCFNER